MSQDGRIIDFFQKQTSHSEGQGYAMLAAVGHRDRAAFDLLWEWTRNNLQVRESDSLFAWSWGEKEPGRWTVIDSNNATDGDLCVAFALFMAAGRWSRDDYRLEALQVMQSIKKELVIEKNGLLCLLPGAYGFEKEEGLVLNPSYFVFSAFNAFAEHDDPVFWDRLLRDSQTLVTRSLDAAAGLPPDWAFYDGLEVVPDESKENRFGFEAVRVLLFLSWAHDRRTIPGLEKYLTRCRNAGYVPAWVDLNKKTLSKEEAPGGFYGVYARMARELNQNENHRFFQQTAERILAGEDRNYYSKILYLLSQLEISQ